MFRDIFGREIMVVAVIKSMWPTKYIRAHIEHKPRISHLSLPEPTLPELCSYTNWKGDSSAKVVNMLSAHIGKSKKYTIQGKRRCPKFTFSTFTPDPNLHKSQIYSEPKFTQPDLHKSIFAHRFQETQVYTIQIYTKPKFTQNLSLKFCSNYIKWIPLSTLVSSKKTMPL